MVIDQKRIVDVFANHSFVVVLLEITEILNDVNAFALAALRWLVDPKVVLLAAA